MELKPGYKNTEVGIIPEEWIASQLGTYVLINSGESPSKYQFSSCGIPYFKVEQLNNDSKYANLTPYRFLSGKTVPAGSIIFPKRGASILLNKIRILSEDSFMDTNLMSLTSTGDLDAEFLYYFLHYAGLEKVADTTSIPQINNKHINPYRVAIPPKVEQTAIAHALSDADALIQSLQKLIKKKRQIKQGAMQTLLNPYENGTLKAGWQQRRLGEVGNCIRGVSYNGDRDLFPHDTQQTARLFRSNNIQQANIDYRGLQFVNGERVKPKQIMQLGDILICMANGSKDLVGKSALFQSKDIQPYTFGAFMGCFRVIEANTDKNFIFYNFQTYKYRNYIDVLLSGSSINNLKPSDIESIEVGCPSLEEQKRISTILLNMDAEISTLESQLAKYQKIKQGMMQNLLTGRIRLV